MYFDPNENLVYPIIALLSWLVVTGCLTLIVSIVSMASLVAARGPSGVGVFFTESRRMLSDIVSLSPRRIWALTRLTFLEAFRRKVLSVFVVFALLFMFAGWFMGNTKEINADQVKVYISFVLTSMAWLTLPVVLILACFGIPEDIRLRSIHTVVTKPARRIEIVVGRILGITLIGFLVLSIMAIIGYIWIVRQTPEKAQGFLTCRVAKYGTIAFRSRDGEPVMAGVNVGDIWAYRSYIEGATKARALWTFDNVDSSVVDADGNLNLENSFSAFRSYKGDMTRNLLYDIKFINPDKNLSYTLDPQPVEENRSKLDVIPTKVTVNDQPYDLIKDFTNDKRQLLVEVSCIDREQYIGMARPDLYIRMPDQPFWVGYWKAVLGVALTVFLFAMIGVSASTIAKGPIATLLTFVLYLMSGAKAHAFIDQLVSTEYKGGGFLESVYRIVTHMGPFTDLPENPAFKMIKLIDNGLTGFLWVCKQVIPQLKSFNMTEFVANGFDVPFETSLLPSILVTAAFILPCVMMGYFALRVRELESK